METVNHIVIQVPLKKVFKAAQGVAAWPRLLPHYRWVTVFSDKGQNRDVEMAASRSGFPCTWRSDQVLYPRQNKIFYLHTRSTWTEGMRVWWILKPMKGGSTQVILTHDMPSSAWFWARLFRQHVVGNFFVHAIADKTLAGLKRHLESR